MRELNQCHHGISHRWPSWSGPLCGSAVFNVWPSALFRDAVLPPPSHHPFKCALFPGLRCDRCSFGFKFLRSLNADGCEPCHCNLHGSVNQLCDPLSGQCVCKKEAKGLRCDVCRENFYGLPWSACEVCDCNRAGTQAGTVCDAETGQCVCKPSVGGRRCSECKEGYFNLRQNDSHLCLPCNCEKTGTVNGSLLCDKSTGQCPCKLGVTGLRCHQCEPHRFNLTVDNLQGCQACECDSLGTLPGSTCDPVSGQCLCLPHRQGRRCERCQPGKRDSLSVQWLQVIPLFLVAASKECVFNTIAAFMPSTLSYLTCLRLSCLCVCCLWGREATCRNLTYFLIEECYNFHLDVCEFLIS